MKKKRNEIQNMFNRANIQRHNLNNIPKSLQEVIFYMDYKIRKSLKSFTVLSICGTDRNNFKVERSFQRAFSTLNLQEKIQYYANHINYAVQILKQQDTAVNQDLSFKEVKNEENQVFGIKIYKGYRNWSLTTIELSHFKVRSKNNNQFKIDIRNYLLRNSKKKDETCYVLEATKPEDPETIRFSFCSLADEELYLPIIRNLINKGLKENLSKKMFDTQLKRKSKQVTISKQFKNTKISQQKKQLEAEHPSVQSSQMNFLRIQPKQVNLLLQSKVQETERMKKQLICQQIMKAKDEQYLDEQLSELVIKQNEEMEENKNNSNNYRNIFRIFLPHYYLQDLPLLIHYKSVYQCQESNLHIYEKINDNLTYKMHFNVNLPVEMSCKAISNMHLYKYWHSQIQEAEVKLKISSQNSCLMHQHFKAFSEWYRDRDFLILMHLFKERNSYYFVGKSIENTNYIPLQSMIRGNIEYMVWQVIPEYSEKQGQKCKIIMEIKVDHCGLLNKSHQKQLTLRYLQGFKNMSKYFEDSTNCKKMLNYMGMNWINTDDLRQSIKTVDFENGSQISIDYKQQMFYSIQNESDQEQFLDEKAENKKNQNSQIFIENQQVSEHQLDHIEEEKASDQSQILKVMAIDDDAKIVYLDQDGNIILFSHYLKKKFVMIPFDTLTQKIESQFDHFILRDYWAVEKGGGLKLINKAIIKAQDGVFGYVMKTLKKNLFSGKGILNISLPVDIFNQESNLQRVSNCMSYAPEFLQKAVDMDPVNRMKQVLAFGLSNSFLYFDVQKPFNPILGETFQGYIRGCPVYAEQISHHPPITSLYFIGRGYKVTANLQSKVNFHINSIDGINVGYNHIVFENDGQEILFQTPSGELCGLAFGDRKFNFLGKGYYIDKKNQLFCEMKFSDDSGFFSKSKRIYIDEICGQIVKVKQDFLTKFISASYDNKPKLQKSDILEKYSEISGRWMKSLQVDGVTIFDVQNLLPDKLVEQRYPLNSHSNYREDIYYKRLKDNVKSQLKKERLEVIQRQDRKHREKYAKKNDH